MAQRIIELLLNDSGVCGLLAGTLESRLDSPKRRQEQTQESGQMSPVEDKNRRRCRKLSDPVVAFLHARRELPIPDLLREVQERFGVTLSPGSVYKAWKLPVSGNQARTA